MALILEQIEARRGDHVVRRIVLGAREVTMGRGLTNDIVLDDPYVDAEHARLVVEPDGALVLTDLGSVNGLQLVGGARVDRIALTPGVEFRLGRSIFRVRDRQAPVVAALPLPPETLTGRWIERPQWALALLAGVIVLGAANTWRAATSRDAGTETFGAVLVVIALTAIWAGGWAAIGRVLTRRAAFLVHVAITSLVGILWTLVEYLNAWAEFLFPAQWTLWTAIEGWVVTVVVAVGLVAHLAYATLMRPRTRWISVVGATITIGAIFVAFDALADDQFTDIPEYATSIRRLPVALVPTTTPELFQEAAAELRAKADEAARKADEREARNSAP